MRPRPGERSPPAATQPTHSPLLVLQGRHPGQQLSRLPLHSLHRRGRGGKIFQPKKIIFQQEIQQILDTDGKKCPRPLSEGESIKLHTESGECSDWPQEESGSPLARSSPAGSLSRSAHCSALLPQTSHDSASKRLTGLQRGEPSVRVTVNWPWCSRLGIMNHLMLLLVQPCTGWADWGAGRGRGWAGRKYFEEYSL